MMPKTYYLHGFASQFDINSDKLKTLARLGAVHGHNIDYTQIAEDAIEESLDKLMQVNPDLLVGTSMGGWLAGILGAESGIPFVAINPVTDPSKTLRPWIGQGTDHQGQPYYLAESVVESYYPFTQYGSGLILLDKGDELLPWRDTVTELGDYFPTYCFEGGSHRFEHMGEALHLILEHTKD
ncbi:MAG: YqiA/YcfP family alpha/beta fold hydrolase [Marinobacter sp.]